MLWILERFYYLSLSLFHFFLFYILFLVWADLLTQGHSGICNNEWCSLKDICSYLLLCSLWKEEDKNVSIGAVTILQVRWLGWMEPLIEFILIQTSYMQLKLHDSPVVPTREHTTRSVLKSLLKFKFDWTGFSVWVFFFIHQPYFGIPAPVSKKNNLTFMPHLSPNCKIPAALYLLSKHPVRVHVR